MQTEFKLSKEKWEYFLSKLYRVETLGNNRLFLNEAISKNFVNDPQIMLGIKEYFEQNQQKIDYVLELYKKRITDHKNLEKELIAAFSAKLINVDIYKIKPQLLDKMDLVYDGDNTKCGLNRFEFFKSLERDGLDIEHYFNTYLADNITHDTSREKFLRFYLSQDFKKDSKKVVDMLRIIDRREHRTFTSTLLDKRIDTLFAVDRDFHTLDYLVGLLDKNSNSTFFKKIEKECKKYSETLLNQFAHKLLKNNVDIDIKESYHINLKLDPVAVERVYNLTTNVADHYLSVIGSCIKKVLAKNYLQFQFFHDKGEFSFIAYSLEDKESMKKIAQGVKDNFSTLISGFDKDFSFVKNSEVGFIILEQILFHQKLDESVEVKSSKKLNKI